MIVVFRVTGGLGGSVSAKRSKSATELIQALKTTPTRALRLLQNRGPNKEGTSERKLTIKWRLRARSHQRPRGLALLVLPNRPHAINLRMMQPKARINGAGVRIKHVQTDRRMSVEMGAVGAPELAIPTREIRTSLQQMRHHRRAARLRA